jgi:nitrogen fixation-related uncharacterized protein
MEAIVMLLVLIVGLSILALTSVTWGTDSRDCQLDDYRR